MINPSGDSAKVPRVYRRTDRRRLGGVCAGLGTAGRIGVGWTRLAFVLGAFCGGLGIAIYLACWLIIPPSDVAEERQGPGALVVLAWTSAAVLVLVVLGALSAAATVFGLGWLVFAAAAATLIVSFVPTVRLGQVSALLAVAALTVPAVAVALSPLRLSMQSGSTVVAPVSVRSISDSTYRSGFGTLLIDLRHTKLPASGIVPLRIDAGVRRTIVALPTDRCVRVTVRYLVYPFVRQLGSLLTGRWATEDYGVVLFGRFFGSSTLWSTRRTISSRARLSGPTLQIDFTSQGGPLFVRDYGSAVSPETDPNWPGFAVTPEARPNLRGEPRRAIPAMLRSWRARRHVELEEARTINPRLPGPCDPPVANSAKRVR